MHIHKLLFQYGRVPLERDLIWQDIVHDTTVTEAEHESGFMLTKDFPYRSLAGELGGVFCDCKYKEVYS